jgi:hypothetical protein
LIEAFEIGVTLALRDGVSDSIAQAKRNVEALQKAVDTSGLSVRTLRDAGLRAITLGNVQPQQDQVRQKAASPARRQEPAGPACAAGETGWPVQSQSGDGPVALGPAHIEVSRVIEREPGEGFRNETTPAPVSAEPSPRVEQAVTRSGAEPYASSDDPKEPGQGEFAAPAEARKEAEPQVWTAGPMRQPELGMLPVPRATEQPQEPYPVVQPGVARSLETEEPRTATPPSTELRTISLGQNSFGMMDIGSVGPVGFDGGAAGAADRVEPVPPGSSPAPNSLLQGVGGMALDGADVGTSVAPDTQRVGEEVPRQPISVWTQGADDAGARAAWFSSSGNLRTVLTTASPQAGSMAPQSRGRAQEAPSGDVYLDGALVGRWMSRFLKREVERAESGPTGFDAKRGRLLPGVTVGG